MTTSESHEKPHNRLAQLINSDITGSALFPIYSDIAVQIWREGSNYSRVSNLDDELTDSTGHAIEKATNLKKVSVEIVRNDIKMLTHGLAHYAARYDQKSTGTNVVNVAFKCVASDRAVVW